LSYAPREKEHFYWDISLYQWISFLFSFVCGKEGPVLWIINSVCEF